MVSWCHVALCYGCCLKVYHVMDVAPEFMFALLPLKLPLNVALENVWLPLNVALECLPCCP